MNNKRKRHCISCRKCDDISFENLNHYVNRLWVYEGSDKPYTLVGAFIGWDGNWWVALKDAVTYTDRQLMMFSQFASRFELVDETQPRWW